MLDKLSELPPELLNDIVGYLPAQSQPLLCRTSRLFNSLSTWRIYRHITLRNWPATLGCFKTLSANVTLASLVQIAKVELKLVIFDLRHLLGVLMCFAGPHPLKRVYWHRPIEYSKKPSGTSPRTSLIFP
jgi:hypothetical protein